MAPPVFFLNFFEKISKKVAKTVAVPVYY